MAKTITEEIEYLADSRIWKTKKARMEAESRMNRNDLISILITNYYTFALLAFSIWGLILDPNSDQAKNVTLMIVIASVGLFGATLLISSLGYKGKALQYKESYLKLDSLESDVRNLLRNAPFVTQQHLIDEFYKCEKKYNEIISLTDNHSIIDHSKLMIDRKLPGSNELRAKYYSRVVIKYVMVFIIFAVPAVLLLIFI